MIYRNAEVFIDGHFRICDFEVIDGRFVAIGNPYLPAIDEAAGDEETNLDGRWVIPGLVDVHTHGSMNADFSDGDYEGLKKMAAYLAKSGVTSFAPAGMTLPYETLAEAFATGKKLHDDLRDPDFDAFKKLYDGCGGLVRIVDVAPELPGAVEFTAKASELTTVSIAHTDASYEEAAAVLDAGATHLTHLYNAMPPIHHRKPGVIGAGSERDGSAEDRGVIAELISDGYHVHPSSVRMAFKLFPGRICLISDSLRCCGMPEGKYELGGQDVFLKGGVARLEDGTIAGSASNVYTCMLNAIEYGIPKETAVAAATITPAREIGADDLIGSIAEGKLADFIICDENLKPERIILGGKEI